jgi:hypothetical protein
MRRIVLVLVLAGSLGIFGAQLVYAGLRPEFSHPSKSQSYHEKGVRGSKGPSAGEISFETLRMLSTGMTPMEVLSRAGRPHYTFNHSRVNRWVYSSTDNWIVEVIFHAGRVIEVKWSKP